MSGYRSTPAMINRFTIRVIKCPLALCISFCLDEKCFLIPYHFTVRCLEIHKRFNAKNISIYLSTAINLIRLSAKSELGAGFQNLIDDFQCDYLRMLIVPERSIICNNDCLLVLVISISVSLHRCFLHHTRTIIVWKQDPLGGELHSEF